MTKPLNGGLLWLEEDHPDHPQFEGATRYILERHEHTVSRDTTDEYEPLVISAVYAAGLGEALEIGPWSLGLQDARILAGSLTALVDVLDQIVASQRDLTPDEARAYYEREN